ncbi:hypothetical protein OA955_01210, partial [Candidatus Marinimicrobia bacterium]|nr:hypothetical protein [Candidatus Neomarinimicrobiota bacterium]
YKPRNTATDYYNIKLEEFKFGFANININTWQDSNYLNPKFEFSGPEISLENLIINAELFKPDWIANEKIKRMNNRQSYPKQRIEEINNSIQLYQTDNKKLPSSINDLIINNYLNTSRSSLNNRSWTYALDLPSRIIAKPTKLNPIPTTKSILYDFNSKKFILDPLVDSLGNVPHLKWLYIFKMKGINSTTSTNLDLLLKDKNSTFSLVMDYAKFHIKDIHFTVEPENKVEDKSTISLHDLFIESQNLILDGDFDSSLTFHQGEGQFRIKNFEIKVPDALSKEPDINNFLSQIGVWNNSVAIRLIDFKIKMINQFTGVLELMIHTPFIRASLEGNLSFRQLDGNSPEIKFHEAKLTLYPIALGLKKWIKNWEKKEGLTLKRKGPAIIIKFNGPIKSLNSQSLKNITFF